MIDAGGNSRSSVFVTLKLEKRADALGAERMPTGPAFDSCWRWSITSVADSAAPKKTRARRSRISTRMGIHSAGGILTELYKDVAFRLAPCTAKEAHLMLEELTIYPTLRGYRGLSGDADSLADIVAKVAELALQLIREGCQLDINPIVCCRDRWIALDVKAIISGNEARRSA